MKLKPPVTAEAATGGWCWGKGKFVSGGGASPAVRRAG
jgi:hypothetical protein